MTRQRCVLAALALALLLTPAVGLSPRLSAGDKGGGWKELFNGKSLDGGRLAFASLLVVIDTRIPRRRAHPHHASLVPRR